MNWWRVAMYTWTACGAGWFVIYFLTQNLAAMFVTTGCLAVAGLISIMESIHK